MLQENVFEGNLDIMKQGIKAVLGDEVLMKAVVKSLDTENGMDDEGERAEKVRSLLEKLIIEKTQVLENE